MPYQSQLDRLASAQNDHLLTPEAAANIRAWLTEDRYSLYAPQVAEHIDRRQWKVLDDAFCAVIPFGTGGRRGTMYPIGANRINERTIGESAQGLATYVKQQNEGKRLACAIAYDTRHRSEDFAKLSAEIMAAAGYTVYFFDGHRSTPELSYAVRMKNCSCGIMITASHNPPSDNGFKAYWSTGGQILPPHDEAVIREVEAVEDIARVPFADAVADGRIQFCQDEVDPMFISSVARQAFPGPRQLKVVYSPLHGVGATAVVPALEADGFTEVEVYGPHAEPNGDFPNVPGHASNPENPRVFDAIVERAKEIGADLVLASDPDGDRIGCAAPLTTSADSDWATFTGNQIGGLLTDYVLQRRRETSTLTPGSYIVKTLVTTELCRRIADSFSVKTHGNLLVGFKWIGGLMDEVGPDDFVFGMEESHGYLAGQYARDKDGAVAAMLLAELAAQVKAEGKTLHEKLDALFWQHGCHAEQLINIMMPGAAGMDAMKELMARLRTSPPEKLGGLKVMQVRDYLAQTVTPVGGSPQALDGPKGDMLILDLEAEGTYVAARPSGTEPKVKFYLFAYEPAEQIADLADTKTALAARLEAISADLRAAAGV